MIKVTVYSLNDKDFNNKLREEKNIITLDQFNIYSIDFFQTLDTFLENNDNNVEYTLIADSNFFTGIKDFFYSKIPQQIRNLSAKLNIKKILVNNPPDMVIQSFKDDPQINLTFKKRPSYSLDISKIKSLKSTLDNEIMGQELAKKHFLITVSKYFYSNTVKPLILGFIGPQGIGKTEMAKAISDCLFPNGKLFREQMSMLNNTEAQDYLFGSENSKRSFAKSLLQRKSEVLLLDEFGLVNPVFYSAFYQMFDEGVFVDGHYTVSLQKSIIICTGNFNSKTDLVNTIGAPLYSRFDDVCYFEPLSAEAYLKIAKVMLYKKMEKVSNNDAKEKINKDLILAEIEKIGKFQDVRSLDHYIDKLIGKQILMSYDIF